MKELADTSSCTARRELIDWIVQFEAKDTSVLKLTWQYGRHGHGEVIESFSAWAPKLRLVGAFAHRGLCRDGSEDVLVVACCGGPDENDYRQIIDQGIQIQSMSIDGAVFDERWDWLEPATKVVRRSGRLIGFVQR
jgi:hypothetical protein